MNVEPAVILGRDPLEDGNVRVRKLLRRGQHFNDPDAAPNELTYSKDIKSIAKKRIQRPCHVRFYTSEMRQNNKIPVPYNRGGMGDCFYVSAQESSDRRLIELQHPWPSDVRQGWNPEEQPSREPLRCLDIFCGGGNFGRGLEEGGSVQCQWVGAFPSVVS